MQKRFEFPKGVLTFERLCSAVLAFHFTGHLEEAAARKIIELRSAAFDDVERAEEFHDWWQMSSYDSASRALLTEDSLKRRQQISRIHLLIASRLVRMGVSVATIVLGDQLVPYAERNAFETARRDAVSR